MMPNWKKKEMGLATDEEVKELKRELKDPFLGIKSYKKGEKYLVPAPALLSQSWDEQLYYVKVAEKDFSSIVFMPYIPSVIK